MGPYQTYKILHREESINIMKRQPTDWQKLFVNDATDKGLISKIQKQPTQLNNIKTNNQIKKWEEGLNRHFSKEDIQMANMERCTSVVISREVQIKTTMRYPLTPIRMTTIKKVYKQCWRRVWRKWGTLLHGWWTCKLAQPLWTTV